MCLRRLRTRLACPSSPSGRTGQVREAEGGGALSHWRRASSTARLAVLAPLQPPASQAINTPAIIKQTLTWRLAARDPRPASEQRPSPTPPSPGDLGDLPLPRHTHTHKHTPRDGAAGLRAREPGWSELRVAPVDGGGCPDPGVLLVGPSAGLKPAGRRGLGAGGTPTPRLPLPLGDSACRGKRVKSMGILSGLGSNHFLGPLYSSSTSPAFSSPFGLLRN